MHDLRLVVQKSGDHQLRLVVYLIIYPKNPDPSKVAILRTRTPAIQVQTLPLEGPRILRVQGFHTCQVVIAGFLPSRV